MGRRPTSRRSISCGVKVLFWESRLLARAVVDPPLRDAFAHRLDVARITGRQPLDPDQHTGAGADVAQPVQPPGVDLGAAFRRG